MSNQSPASLEQYTVIASGVRFTLSRTQIEHDSPNYFTSLFLGDFAESTTKTVHLDKDPYLFELITKHLSGYEILPLETKGLPSWMSRELAERNLALDAEYFGLDALQQLLSPKEAMPPVSAIKRACPAQPTQLVTQHMFDYLRWCGLSSEGSTAKAFAKHRIVQVLQLRENPGLITFELLTGQFEVPPSPALIVMARQNEAAWRVWDEYCLQRRITSCALVN